MDKGKNYLSYDNSDIGNYKALLSQIIAINRQDLIEMSDQDKMFWTVVLRYLRKQLRKQQLELPTSDYRLSTKPLSKEVIEVCFPKGIPLKLSATALTVFIIISTTIF